MIQGDYDLGVVATRASQKLHSVLISFQFSREPSAVSGSTCCLMIPPKSKGIFSWDVSYLIHVTELGG